MPAGTFRMAVARLGRPWPLRWHLVLLVVGVLVPAVAFSAVIVRELASQQQAMAERRLVQAAHDLAGLLDREMASTFGMLDALGRSDHLARGDLAGYYAELKRVLPSQPSWSLVILLAPDGRQLLNTKYEFGRPLSPVNESESLRRVVETGRPAVGSLVQGKEGSLLAFPVRVPVKYGGEVRYVLTAVIEPGAVRELVSNSAPGNDEWTRTVVDAKGTIVARTRDPDRFVGQAATPAFYERVRALGEGTTRSTTLDGREVYTGFSRARVSDWTAAVVVPVEVVDGPAWRSRVGLAVGGGAMLLLSAGGAFLLSRRLARQIAAASRAAQTLSRGEVPVLPRASVAEVERLGEAMRRAAELLGRRERERDEHLRVAEAAQAQAEAASRAKDEFLAMLGHELRNPLGPIRTGVHLLSTLPPGDERALRVYETIERQVAHMARLVDDLLDASRVARGLVNLELRPGDLRAVVRDVVGDFGPQFEAAGVGLEVSVPDAPVPVDGDRTRLAQSLGNLLHNALKFTPRGGRTRVQLRAEDGWALLAVQDDGAGIDPELLSRLFQPFSQGRQSLGRSHGGLGLGLALVKGLVSLHGGTVEARSDGARRGATFVIRLALTDKPIPAESATPKGGEVTANQAGRRVLIVEDLGDAARTLKLLLSRDGHEVRVAPTGADALSAVDGFTPDVVVCDIGLPDMDGYDLCRRLKGVPSLRGTRMIALTGYGQSEDVARAAEAGFHVHLTKPVDVATLRSAVAGAVGAARG